MKFIAKIKTKNNFDGAIFELNKKKFIRIEGKNGIEWRRLKTNHEVNKVEFDYLEGVATTTFPRLIKIQPKQEVKVGQNVHSPYSAFVNLLRRNNKKTISDFEKRVLKASSDGTEKLRGVKFIKDETGWSLLESKEFFEEFIEKLAKNK
jgi:ribosomal protein L7/L12